VHQIGRFSSPLLVFIPVKLRSTRGRDSGLVFANFLGLMVEQPHFDEVTTQTARPVVPLEKIDARIKHKRRWFLGGAFAIAMLLGAASALVSAYFKLRNVPDPEIQSLSVLPENPPQLPTVQVIAERPKPRSRNTDRTEKQVTDVPVVQPRLSEEEQLRRIRDAVLIEQWQERRERRVQRRERRRAQHRDRDLSNLDEIFEGPRHP
jgi:hypothetical protein